MSADLRLSKHTADLGTAGLLSPNPSNGASLFVTLSYIPIGLAFHATVISTLGVSLSTSSSLSTTPSAKKRWWPLTGLWTGLLFVLSHVPMSVVIDVYRKRQQCVAKLLTNGIDEAARSSAGLLGLISLVPEFDKVTKLSLTLFTLYRVEVGIYGLWAFCWMAVSFSRLIPLTELTV